jgi:NADPH:quinone reductase-like Zn-dependent oxidoreductase
MYAAVVSAFDAPPRYQQMAAPAPDGEYETVVDVLAAGLHPRVRSQADGSHYTSTGELPLVPGVDGVARLPDGGLVYFILPDTTMGAIAERTVIDRRRSIVLPDDIDPVLIAAAMNPAMSSWVGLRQRTDFRPGQSILVLGATGNAGQLAIQIGKHFGASRVVGAGRNQELLDSLPALGADATVSLSGDPADAGQRLAEAAAEVDLVIDYLWGTPAERAMTALLAGRSDRSRSLTWLQIGAIAGPTIVLPSVALRSANLRVLGSGQGSVTAAGILAELPQLVREVANGTFAINPVAVPLAAVEQAWTAPTRPGQRVVIVPS